jgi:hypothetical protein
MKTEMFRIFKFNGKGSAIISEKPFWLYMLGFSHAFCDSIACVRTSGRDAVFLA